MKKLVLVAHIVLGLVSAASAQSLVTFYTNQGNFVVELDDSIMPITAGNFKTLVTAKFYDGVIFHRVISSFVIQGGDPTGTGSGGPGYTIQDEFVSGQSNLKQTLSMANTGQPNTGGSQFFINVEDNLFLDFNRAPTSSKHPVFAKVISGWTVVETLNSRRSAIYPNPITNESVLDLYLETGEQLSFDLLDQSGQIIFKSSENCDSGKSLLSLEDLGVRNLSVGTYYLAINGENTHKTLKFVVSH